MVVLESQAHIGVRLLSLGAIVLKGRQVSRAK